MEDTGGGIKYLSQTGIVGMREFTPEEDALTVKKIETVGFSEQPATPVTFDKEVLVFVAGLKDEIKSLCSIYY